jgi:hypothetical protein
MRPLSDGFKPFSRLHVDVVSIPELTCTIGMIDLHSGNLSSSKHAGVQV